MWLEMREVFGFLSTSPDVRAIVLSGKGDRAFTTGLDVVHAAQTPVLKPDSHLDGARQAQIARRHIFEFQDCISAIERCEKPVVCIMHGYCYGLAMDIACCADVRFCSADAKFCVKEVDIGLAADIGTLTRLPKIVGSYGWVKEISLSAKIFGPEEADKNGLVSGVFPKKADALEAGLKWASAVASKSPVAVQGTKELLNYSIDHTVPEGS